MHTPSITAGRMEAKTIRILVPGGQDREAWTSMRSVLLEQQLLCLEQHVCYLQVFDLVLFGGFIHQLFSSIIHLFLTSSVHRCMLLSHVTQYSTLRVEHHSKSKKSPQQVLNWCDRTIRVHGIEKIRSRTFVKCLVWYWRRLFCEGIEL